MNMSSMLFTAFPLINTMVGFWLQKKIRRKTRSTNENHLPNLIPSEDSTSNATMDENETRMGIVTTMICENGDGRDNIGEADDMFHAKKTCGRRTFGCFRSRWRHYIILD